MGWEMRVGKWWKIYLAFVNNRLMKRKHYLYWSITDQEFVMWMNLALMNLLKNELIRIR